MRHRIYTLSAIGLASVSTACSSDNLSAPSGATALESVIPAAGATGIDSAGTIQIRFSGPMASGVERYVDLHQGDVAGQVVPMPCGLSADRATVTCTPAEPLRARTRYTIHLGGGMMDANGQPTETEEHGTRMGGQPVTGEMMGGVHAGETTDMMSPGWGHAGDDYWGMAFTFETA